MSPSILDVKSVLTKNLDNKIVIIKSTKTCINSAKSFTKIKACQLKRIKLMTALKDKHNDELKKINVKTKNTKSTGME
jgi:hypothetical protein